MIKKREVILVIEILSILVIRHLKFYLGNMNKRLTFLNCSGSSAVLPNLRSISRVLKYWRKNIKGEEEIDGSMADREFLRASGRSLFTLSLTSSLAESRRALAGLSPFLMRVIMSRGSLDEVRLSSTEFLWV
jgi:hypothetical protein